MMSVEQLRLIRVTLRDDVRPVLEGATEVSGLYEQFRSVFFAGDAHHLFAKPVSAVDQDGRPVTRWLTEAEGEIRAFDVLNEGEQKDLLLRARAWMGRLFRQIEEQEGLATGDLQIISKSLEKAFEVPGTGSVYRVGSQPVLTEWGSVYIAWNAPRRVLRVLFDERLACGDLVVLVREPDGATPVVNARVDVHRDNGLHPEGTVHTDQTGAARFAAVPLDAALSIQVFSSEGGAASIGNAVTQVPTGSPRMEVTITVSRPRPVRLILVDGSTRQPLAGATLRGRILDDTHDEQKVDGVSDAGGSIALADMAKTARCLDGRVFLTTGVEQAVRYDFLNVSATEYVIPIDTETSAVPTPWWRRLTFVAAALLLGILGVLGGMWWTCIFPFGPAHCVLKPQIATPQLMEMHINVVDADGGAPLPGATVEFQQANAQPISRTTDQMGQVTFTAVPVGAELTLVGRQPGYIPDQKTERCCASAPKVIALQRLPMISSGQENWTSQVSGVHVAAVLAAGTRNVRLEIDSNSVDDDIEVFTASGMHIAGTPLSDEVWLDNNIRTPEDIRQKVFQPNKLYFEPSASYDATQLNDANGQFNTSNLYHKTVHGMDIAYSGDGFRTKNDFFEKLEIPLVTEKLLIFVVGGGKFQYKSHWDTEQK